MFGSLIPAATLLGLVKGEIEKSLKTTINRFDMVYKREDNAIQFVVYLDGKKRVYPYDDENGMLVSGFQGYLSTNLKSGDTIDYAIVKYYEDKPCVSDVYYTSAEGEKLNVCKEV